MRHADEANACVKPALQGHRSQAKGGGRSGSAYPGAPVFCLIIPRLQVSKRQILPTSIRGICAAEARQGSGFGFPVRSSLQEPRYQQLFLVAGRGTNSGKRGYLGAPRVVVPPPPTPQDRYLGRTWARGLSPLGRGPACIEGAFLRRPRQRHDTQFGLLCLTLMIALGLVARGQDSLCASWNSPDFALRSKKRAWAITAFTASD